MKSLLFIGFEFHRITGSADFLLSLLEEHFNVTRCYVDLLFSSDPYSVLQDVDKKEFDVLVCWQVMPPREKLNALFHYAHAAFFPMIDGCPSVLKTEKWWIYRDFNIISFSKSLAKQLLEAGFSARYIQYFPEPSDRPIIGDPCSAFFWCRREAISIPLIEELLSETDIRHLHIHKVPDPGNSFIGPAPDSSSTFTYSTWYDTKQEMLKDVASCACYVAPREKEGIGFSFLEAMAMGKCVIAPNQPTMNEYIEHGKTGLLYNLKKPEPFSAFDLTEIQQTAHAMMQKGFRQWQENKNSILEWLEAPVELHRGKLFLFMLRRFFKNPRKVCRTLKRELGNNTYE